jgi:hypothetical protein
VDVSVAAQSVVLVRSAFRQHAATEVGVLVRAATEVGVLVRLGPRRRWVSWSVVSATEVGVLVRAATEVGVLVRLGPRRRWVSWSATEVGVLVCGLGPFGLPSARRDGGGCLGPLVAAR